MIFFFLSFLLENIAIKEGKIIILSAFQQLMPAVFLSSYRSVASRAVFLRGCCQNSVFEDAVSNIFGKQILTIILMSLISHIIIFVFYNIKGIYCSFILTLKLIIQFLSCSSDFWLIESINHRNELSIASIASNLRNYVRAMTNRIQFACFGNLYPIHYRVSFVT